MALEDLKIVDISVQNHPDCIVACMPVSALKHVVYIILISMCVGVVEPVSG